MHQIRPPFLELSFYWQNQSNYYSFHNLVAYLLANGAEAEGPIEDGPATGMYKTLLRHVTGTTGRSEIVSSLYLITPEAAKNDWCPIAIWTEGEIFCWPEPTKKQRLAARSTGKAVAKKFLQICDALNPDYASINVEYGLQCLTDLKANPSSCAFKDFYLRRNFVGSQKLERILNCCAGSYRKDLEDGIYISSSGDFNPAKINVDGTNACCDAARILTERS